MSGVSQSEIKVHGPMSYPTCVKERCCADILLVATATRQNKKTKCLFGYICFAGFAVYQPNLMYVL